MPPEQDSVLANTADELSAASQVIATPVRYHGWSGSYLLSNGTVEAVIVPAIGRVMRFAFCGGANVFWTNRALDGKFGDNTDEWMNFGGDKTWPAPQSDWAKLTPRPWPPPPTFDALPVEPSFEDGTALLASGVDPCYGIRVIRRVALDASLPVMQIITEYHKVEGPPVTVAVWVITQLPDPERVFILLPARPQFRKGYVLQRDPVPHGLRKDGRLLSLQRDPVEFVKIGSDGSALLWMDAEHTLRIDGPDQRGTYPNGGSRTEIYTNPDVLPYIELETNGRLTTLKTGDVLAETNTYTLGRRSMPEALSEARDIFGL